jgi:hypothetical protein
LLVLAVKFIQRERSFPDCFAKISFGSGFFSLVSRICVSKAVHRQRIENYGLLPRYPGLRRQSFKLYREYPEAGYLPDCLVDHALSEPATSQLPPLTAEKARSLFRCN